MRYCQPLPLGRSSLSRTVSMNMRTHASQGVIIEELTICVHFLESCFSNNYLRYSNERKIFDICNYNCLVK